MDEATALGIDILYRSSVELGHALEAFQVAYDLHHAALSSLHDIAVAEHATATVLPFERDPA